MEKPGKYLGMPMYVGKSKEEVFGPVRDRVHGKLQGWWNKDLSKGGKLTLVKSAAQSIPNFWMSLFLFPEFLCTEIENKMNAFLRGSDANGKGIKWITWKRLCVPKEYGGLGLKELRKFNLAMLAKQGWRLLNESNPLVTAVMKARYYPKVNFLNADLGSNPSYVWRSIMEALDAVKAGAQKKIGDGEGTTVWNMPWLPDRSNGFINTPAYNQIRDIKVSSLMVSGERRWDMEVLNDLFEERDVKLIKCIPIPIVNKADSWFWLLDGKGEFSVRSC